MTTPRLGSLAGLLAALVACGGSHSKTTTTSNTGVLVAAAADPDLIEMSTEATTTLVAASTTSQLGVRLQIRALEVPDAKRPPLNLCLVLDTSGSMEGDAIAALRDGASRLIAQMRDGDRISVVGFNSKVDVLAPNTVLDAAARERIARLIHGIEARGTTDLAAGLAVGLQQVQAGRLPAGINRIVVFSDGVPNTAAPIPALVATAHDLTIGVTTLGFGVDYDTTLMTQLARDTGGTFHYIESPDAVAAVFETELARMTTVVGRNLQLVLAPGPGVTIEPMPGLVVGGDGKVHATIGDLAAGEQRDLMIPIKVAGRAEGSTAELVDATLTFDDVIGHSGRQQRDGFVAVKTSNDAAAVKDAVKMELEVARVRTAAASAILDAIALARQHQLEAARNRLENAATVVRAAATRLRDPELAAIVVQIEEVAKQLAQLVPQQMIVPTDASRTVSTDSSAPSVAPAAVEMKLRRTEEKASHTVRGSAR